MWARDLSEPRVHSELPGGPRSLTGGTTALCACVEPRGCDLASLTVGPARQQATVQVVNGPIDVGRSSLDQRL